MLTWKDRAFTAINLGSYNELSYPDYVFDYTLSCPHERQYVLRAMIKDIHKDFNIPSELEWTRELVMKCHEHQMENNIRHAFCYITVRHGIHTAVTDDEWHVDGFSQVITCLPEQNYIVANSYPTEYVALPIDFPKDFNPLRHDAQKYIQDEVAASGVEAQTTKANVVNLFDPYVIHRRPVDAEGKERTFVRITFVSVEICDDDCYTAFGKYNRTASDTRDKLVSYEQDIS